MKKLAALLVSLVMLIACMGAVAEDVDYTGDWYGNLMIENGTEMALSSMGMEMVITLNADGTAKLHMSAMGDVMDQEGTWKAVEGGVSVNDGEMDMVMLLQDGNLVADEDGSAMVFGREQLIVEMFDAGAVVTEVTLEDFNGEWAATLVDMMGAQLPYAETNGMDTVLVIENGAATMINIPLDSEEGEEGALTAELKDGVLVLTSEPDEYDNVTVINLKLHETGVLSWTEEMGEDMSMVIYFEEIVEEDVEETAEEEPAA